MIFGKYINKYYAKYGIIFLIGIASLVAVDVYQLKIPEIYGQIVDGLDPTTTATITVDLLKTLCKNMLIIIAVMVVGRFLWRICFFGTAIKVETDLKNKMFDHCKDLSQNFYSQNKVGNLMSLFTNDIDTINECFGDGALMLFDALALGGLSLYKMFKINPVLTFVSFIPMILMGIMSYIVGHYMMKKWELRQEAFSKLSDFTQEAFSGIAVIKAFVKEFKELLAFKKINKENENINVEFTKMSALLSTLVTLFVQSVVCIILGVGGYYASVNQFNSAKLIEFISYFNSIVWPIMAFSHLIEMSSRGKASIKRIQELLDSKIEVYDKENVRTDINEIKGKIEFRNLTFKYPNAEYDSLINASFVINEGENVGIIGKTGSGKTTLVDLILRTYNVPDNSIFIDNVDINLLPIKLVRKYCAYVPQDNFLFSTSVADNIAFSKKDVSIEEIKKASILASLDENILDFKDGYETVLGERGVTISGGQKQIT